MTVPCKKEACSGSSHSSIAANVLSCPSAHLEGDECWICCEPSLIQYLAEGLDSVIHASQSIACPLACVVVRQKFENKDAHRRFCSLRRTVYKNNNKKFLSVREVLPFSSQSLQKNSVSETVFSQHRYSHLH